MANAIILTDYNSIECSFQMQIDFYALSRLAQAAGCIVARPTALCQEIKSSYIGHSYYMVDLVYNHFCIA